MEIEYLTVTEFRDSGALKMATEVLWARNVKVCTSTLVTGCGGHNLLSLFCEWKLQEACKLNFKITMEKGWPFGPGL